MIIPTCEEKITKTKLQMNEHKITFHVNNKSHFKFYSPRLESTKLGVLRAHVSTCLACICAHAPPCLGAYVLTRQRVLHAYVLTWQRALRAYVLTCQRVLHA